MKVFPRKDGARMFNVVRIAIRQLDTHLLAYMMINGRHADIILDEFLNDIWFVCIINKINFLAFERTRKGKAILRRKVRSPRAELFPCRPRTAEAIQTGAVIDDYNFLLWRFGNLVFHKNF